MRYSIFTLAFALVPAGARADVPALVPVQGFLSDAAGVPVDGPTAMTLAVYDALSGGNRLYVEQQVVAIERGAFTVYLGSGTHALDLSIFGAGATWLGLTVGADAELEPRIALGTAPYAALAQQCSDADAVGGLAPADLARATHTHDFSALTGVPADLADGDADTTYTAGPGLTLMGDMFIVDSAAVAAIATTACLDSEAELTGLLDDNYAARTHTHPWVTLTGIPSGFADGVDNDTTYSAGAGLSLAGTVLSVNGVTSAMVVDGTLTSADLADGTLTGADVAPATTLNVARVQYSTPRLHRDLVGEARFRARTPGATVNCCTGVGGAYIANGASDAIVAPILVPEGAIITQMTVYYVDNDATVDLRVDLYAHAFTGGYASVESYVTSGNTNSVRSAVVDVSPDYTVASGTSLHLAVYGTSAGALVAWPTSLRVMGTSIDYTVAEAP